jgi:hypothetical protein
MAATLRDLRSQLKSRRVHYGFGQEPVPPKSARPKNYALAKFILEHGRIPEVGELAAFKKKLKADEKK